MPSDDSRSLDPFITAYGPHPVVVMTEFGADAEAVHACIVRPRCLSSHTSGPSWHQAHWQLFNSLLSEYMNLDRNRSQLGPELLLRLLTLDELRDNGTLKLLAAIARSGFPPELHEAGLRAPVRIDAPG